MIIAHLPLGYLATKTIVTKCSNNAVKKSYLIKAGLIGSITPDLDMFYFYIFDNCQHHHHTYWIHIPFYWGIILGLFFLMFLFIKKDLLPLIGIFGINIFIHLFADSIVGDIWWFSPFTNKPYSLFTVPSIYKIWWGNFILH